MGRSVHPSPSASGTIPGRMLCWLLVFSIAAAGRGVAGEIEGQPADVEELELAPGAEQWLVRAPILWNGGSMVLPVPDSGPIILGCGVGAEPLSTKTQRSRSFAWQAARTEALRELAEALRGLRVTGKEMDALQSAAAGGPAGGYTLDMRMSVEKRLESAVCLGSWKRRNSNEYFMLLILEPGDRERRSRPEPIQPLMDRLDPEWRACFLSRRELHRGGVARVTDSEGRARLLAVGCAELSDRETAPASPEFDQRLRVAQIHASILLTGYRNTEIRGETRLRQSVGEAGGTGQVVSEHRRNTDGRVQEEFQAKDAGWWVHPGGRWVFSAQLTELSAASDEGR